MYFTFNLIIFILLSMLIYIFISLGWDCVTGLFFDGGRILYVYLGEEEQMFVSGSLPSINSWRTVVVLLDVEVSRVKVSKAPPTLFYDIPWPSICSASRYTARWRGLLPWIFELLVTFYRPGLDQLKPECHRLWTLDVWHFSSRGQL